MIEVLKQALDALESCGEGHITDGGNQWHDAKLVDTATTSLRQAIAELESQEPDKYEMDIECTKCGAKQSGVLTVNTHPPQRTEPKVCCQQYDTCLEPCTPRGEHLAQRTWVGLTGEMLLKAAQSSLAPEQYDHFEAMSKHQPDIYDRLAYAIRVQDE